MISASTPVVMIPILSLQSDVGIAQESVPTLMWLYEIKLNSGFSTCCSVWRVVGPAALPHGLPRVGVSCG
jgi:hypothetical protein